MATAASMRDEERHARREFATNVSEDGHRVWQAELYRQFERYNAEFFGGHLKTPHIGFGRTPPRSLSICSRLTDYGAPVQITLHAGLVFGSNTNWVLNPMSEGHRRAVADLFLRMTVQHYVIEHLGVDESRYYGYGPRFHQEVNRLSVAMALPTVIFDRSGMADSDQPICKGWPHNVRPEDYYGQDITRLLLERLSHTSASQRAGAVLPPSLGVWEYMLYLLTANRHEDIRSIAATQLDWLKSRRADYPVLAKFEKGSEDEDGMPLNGLPDFDPSWLTWNGGIVRHLAEGIHAFRSYVELPILADALEDAGCADAVILRHLRANTKGHDSRCWVLKNLIDR